MGGVLQTPVRSDGFPEVVTFGESMVLLRARVGVPLAHADALDVDVAGAEGNVAVGLSRLGHRVKFVTRVGDDPFGALLVRRYLGEGVDIAAARDPDRFTGLLARDVFADRPIEVGYYRRGSAASTLSPSDVPHEAIRQAKVLHLTGITTVLSADSFAAVQAAVETAVEAGTLVSFDPNLRLRLASAETSVDRWRQVLPNVDVILAGQNEAALIVGDGTDQIEALHQLGPQVVVIKSGSRGSVGSDGQQRIEVEAHHVVTADPVGAGDAFAAGFLSGVLDELNLADCLRSGTAVAAAAVQCVGDIAGLPDRSTRDYFLKDDEADVRR